MSKRYILFPLLLLLCITATLRHVQIVNALPYIDINVDTAYDMITNGTFPNLVILDVRYQYEYDSEHLYDAFLIPYDELEARIDELKDHENHEIIVYCRSGGRSSIASGTLDAHNFTKVYNMQGGILAWKAAGYPVWPLQVHNIDTKKNYSGIQEAISAIETQDGDTIMVEVATYYEHVIINKAITLMAKHPEATIIDGNGTGNVLEIATANVNITGFTMKNGSNGIYFTSDFGSSVLSNNNILNNANGVFINKSDGHVIRGNTITDNEKGIQLYATCFCDPVSGNTIINNIIADNGVGIQQDYSQDNLFYHNNFINNTNNSVVGSSLNDIWDDGYPSGGNYWGDYNGTDLYSGLYQNETGSDGIGDTAYIIDTKNQDRYPLLSPWMVANGPTARFIYFAPYPYLKVTFNASTSTYGWNGTHVTSIVNYAWDFGDGNITTVSYPVIYHIYAANGTYTVMLNATDSQGLWDIVSQTVTVSWPNLALVSIMSSDGYLNSKVPVSITVKNEGVTFATFNVTVYYTNETHTDSIGRKT